MAKGCEIHVLSNTHWDRAIGVARDYPYVYLELTAAYHVNGIIEKIGYLFWKPVNDSSGGKHTA